MIRYCLDNDGRVLEGLSDLDYDRINKLQKSLYLGDGIMKWRKRLL